MNILTIAAHPDDELLGAGGTLAREVAEGHDVHVLIMAQGAMSRGADWQKYQATLYEQAERVRGADWQKYQATLYEQAERVRKLLGFDSYSFANFPDQEMDSVNILQLVKCVESHVQRLQPSVVYTHWHGDLNLDHRLTAEAVLTACRPQPLHSVREIYAMEVVSATGWNYQQFQPNVYVGISDYWKLKQEALSIYAGEMRETPHARSMSGLFALAQHRGHTVGLHMAEAFELVRRIET